MKCEVKNCEQEATMESPAHICYDHWQMWFNAEEDDAKVALKQLLEGVELPQLKD